jgi:hypothetical protein
LSGVGRIDVSHPLQIAEILAVGIEFFFDGLPGMRVLR